MICVAFPEKWLLSGFYLYHEPITLTEEVTLNKFFEKIIQGITATAW